MLRCGVAGLRRGKIFTDAFQKLPQCELVAVCAAGRRSLAPYSHLAAHTDFASFLDEKLDVAAIVTPGPFHARQSIEALKRGIHVLCETPCVYTLDEAEELVRTVRETGKLFMLAENYLWMGWYLDLAKRCERGLFGPIIYAEGDYTHDCRDLMLHVDGEYIPYTDRGNHPEAEKSWRADGLPPLIYSSHTLGPLLGLMKDRVVSCTGVSAGGRTSPDLGTTDLESGLLVTEKGSVIRLTNGFTVAHPMALHYKIIGTTGSAIIRRDDGAEGLFYSDSEATGTVKWKREKVDFKQRPDGRDSTEVMIEDFISSVLENRKPPLDVHQSLDMVIPGLVAHQSAEQGGKKLSVPDFRRQ